MSEDFRRRLYLFFEKYDSPKLAHLLQFTQKCEGKEEAFLRALTKKYGPEPPFTPFPMSQRVDFKNKLVDFYQKHDKKKVLGVDQIVAKYIGAELELFSTLNKKYKSAQTEPKEDEKTATAGDKAIPPATDKGKREKKIPPANKAVQPSTPREAVAALPEEMCDDDDGVHFRERLERFYNFYDPSKAGNIDAILSKYRGNEEELMRVLVKKYGKEPDAQTASDQGDSQPSPESDGPGQVRAPIELRRRDRAQCKVGTPTPDNEPASCTFTDDDFCGVRVRAWPNPSPEQIISACFKHGIDFSVALDAVARIFSCECDVDRVAVVFEIGGEGLFSSLMACPPQIATRSELDTTPIQRRLEAVFGEYEPVLKPVARELVSAAAGLLDDLLVAVGVRYSLSMYEAGTADAEKSLFSDRVRDHLLYHMPSAVAAAPLLVALFVDFKDELMAHLRSTFGPEPTSAFPNPPHRPLHRPETGLHRAMGVLRVVSVLRHCPSMRGLDIGQLYAQSSLVMDALGMRADAAVACLRFPCGFEKVDTDQPYPSDADVALVEAALLSAGDSANAVFVLSSTDASASDICHAIACECPKASAPVAREVAAADGAKMRTVIKSRHGAEERKHGENARRNIEGLLAMEESERREVAFLEYSASASLISNMRTEVEMNLLLCKLQTVPRVTLYNL